MYTQEEIRSMIDGYRSMCNVLEELIPDMDSNSIAQYGIEATLPKPQGVNNSKVESCVALKDKVTTRQAKLIEKIEFINKKQEEIEDDDTYFFIELLKRGKKRNDILIILNINRNDYTDWRRKIIEDLYNSQFE
ncbi:MULTISPECIES: hypothetical protein [Mammaliicoccus]|uniref:Phage protein n=1 Tax=Mammaliicoccus sciuri TaxID=1296 RepID=A0AAW5LSU5_MAMSC|nr:MULTISPECIES: hypothetical protein [Mammaliicoccus]MCQ9304993.1 hypothetical protein [Mammaliicoccus sciuri]